MACASLSPDSMPNDKVIVAGLQKILFPGAPVKPNEVPMAAPPAAARTR